MKKRKTAGALAYAARQDTTRYDPLEIGHALTDDVVEQLKICASRHNDIFNEEEYFLILIVAGDPLIYGLRRHKYAAVLHMPQPRPQQSVFLYNKKTNKMKRLWSLPDAKVMAVTSEMKYVASQWSNTKKWCDAFFTGKFFEFIRKQHGIKHLAEIEYLDLHREELIQAGCQQMPAGHTEAFDFSKIQLQHVEDTTTALSQ